MKNLLFFLSLFYYTVAVAQVHIGGDGAVHSNNTNLPPILGNEAKGTPKSVATIAQRNAIPTAMRDTGMFCYVGGSVDSTYQLRGGIANSNWTVFSSGNSTVNYITGGMSGYLLDTTIATDGLHLTISIPVDSNVITNVDVKGDNGNDWDYWEVIGDTVLLIHYGDAPQNNVHYIISGQAVQLPQTGLIDVPVGNTAIQLTWRDIKNAIAYEVQRSYDSVNWFFLDYTGPHDTTYLDTGLLAHNKYYHRVKPKGDGINYYDGNFSYASAVTAALAALQSPSIVATGISVDSNRITITNVANAISYDLKYSVDSGKSWLPLVVLPPGTLTFYHTQLSANKTFYYQLIATADNTNYANAPPVYDSATTLAPTLSKLAAPNFQANTISYDEIDIIFTPEANSTGFVLYYLNPSDSSYTALDTLAPNETTFKHVGLSDTTTYNYAAIAVGDGVNYISSDYSYNYATTYLHNVSGNFVLRAPVITATPNGAHAIHVTLDTTAHAYKIIIERSINNQTWTALGTYTPAVTMINDANLAANTTYNYRAHFIPDSTGADSIYQTSDYGNAAATTAALVQLYAPVTTASNINSSSNSITWTNEANESGYTVQYSRNKSTWSTLTTKAADVTSATHTGLPAATKFYYRVRTNAAANGSYSNSVYSNIDSATTSAGTSTLTTPVVNANGVDIDENLVQWGSVPNADNYIIDKSLDGATWFNIVTVAAGTLAYSDTALQPNTVYNYRVQASSNNPAFLTSAYGYDTAKTLSIQYVTAFGLLSEVTTSGYDQPTITAITTDSLGICIVRSNWASVENSARIDKVLSFGKELHLNMNNFALGDTTRGYTTDAERPAYIYSLDTVIRRHLLGKNVRFISASNEENNNLYRKIDTVNSARLYAAEMNAVDSVAKAIAPNQFVTSNAGVTGKPVMWFPWRNLMDSGKVTEANAFAREVFLPSEIPSLATWDKKGGYAIQITFLKQLMPYYRASNINYFNVHPKMPLNGIDTLHLNPIVLRDIQQGWHNLTGKEIITDEIAANSLNPTYTTDMAQQMADLQWKYGLFYDGSAFTTIPTAAGKDPSFRLQSDGRTLNAIGNAAKQKFATLHPQACPITLSFNPTVDAGNTKTIVYAGTGTKVNLTGSATNAATTTWTQLKGPNTATIAAPNNLTSSFTGLQQGVYAFQLSATSVTGTTVYDTAFVSVLVRMNWTAGGIARTALVHLPASGVMNAPVIMAFHGHSQQALSFAVKCFERYADSFIVVYAQGLPTPSGSDPNGNEEGWQRTTPYTNPNFPGIVDPDIKFFDTIRRVMIDTYHADSTLVFVHGWSNGAIFIYNALWGARNSIIAGGSTAAAILNTTSGKTAKPWMHIAGVDDDKVSFTSQQGNIPKLQGLNSTGTTGVTYATAPGSVVATKYTSTISAPIKKDFVWLQYKGGHPYPDNTVPPIIIKFIKEEIGL